MPWSGFGCLRWHFRVGRLKGERKGGRRGSFSTQKDMEAAVLAWCRVGTDGGSTMHCSTTTRVDLSRASGSETDVGCRGGRPYRCARANPSRLPFSILLVKRAEEGGCVRFGGCGVGGRQEWIVRERESISYDHGRDVKDTIVNICSERLELFLSFSSKGEILNQCWSVTPANAARGP